MQHSTKKGQVAIFVIVAIVIIGILLLVMLYPKMTQKSSSYAFSPNSFLQSCVEPQIRPVIAQLSQHGGYLTPEGTVKYKGMDVKYLCYTSENYKTCVNQQPLIKENFENNLQSFVTSEVERCMTDLKSEYESQQYAVTIGNVNTSVSIIPNKVRVNIDAPITVTKDGNSQSFNTVQLNINSEMYDLLLTASSVIEFESTYGNSNTGLYMQYYPNLNIYKDQLSDGTRIYTLSNVITNESFMFASRSVPWPAGYGT
jgi:hypothetical protein